MKLLLFCLSMLSLASCAQEKTLHIPPSHPQFVYSGRIDRSDTTSYRFSYPAVAIRATFTGQHCTLLLRNESQNNSFHNQYYVVIDDQAPLSLAVGNKDKRHVLSLAPNRGSHTLYIFKKTESMVGLGIFEGLELDKGAQLLPTKELPARRIEFIGNSITCGYGNEGDSPQCHFSPETENAYLSYAAITARNLSADYLFVAYSGKGVVSNYDLDDKQTMPKLYDRVFPWDNAPNYHRGSWKPDVVVINLGTNDFAHHVPDSALFVSTYVSFLKKLHTQYPNATFFCIEACMTKDDWPVGIPSLTLVKRFIERAVIVAQTRGINKSYAYFPSSMQQGEIGCDWHPNVIRHKKMADELTAFIRQKMNW